MTLLSSQVERILNSKIKLIDCQLGFHSRYVSANGVNFFYVERGQGQVMLFLHGYPFFGSSWIPLLERFSESYHVIAPDNRGYGYSSKPHSVSEYHLSKLVNDVKALLNIFVPEESVVLVGHDWGGTLAWAVAQVHPELISKLIVINAPPQNVLLKSLLLNAEQRQASSYMNILKTSQLEDDFEKEGPSLLWQYGFDKLLIEGYIGEQFKAVFFESWNQAGALRSALNWYRANIPSVEKISEESYWPEKYSRVTVPSLLIRSENESAFVPQTFDLISDYVDDLTVKVIPNSGHAPFYDQADLVATFIKEFL